MVNIFECHYQVQNFSSVNIKLVLRLLSVDAGSEFVTKKSSKGCKANLQSGKCYVTRSVGAI